VTEENVKMKQKIEIILEETGYKESRAAKMDLNDILKYVASHPLMSLLMSAL
jgi:18S rRNA (adenine1779-N6/adenine1780-N6)-dimethyltransferase